jgi:choline dehydrogenase
MADWEDVDKMKSENFTRPGAAFAQERNILWKDSVHGFNGPVHASYAPYDYPSSSKFSQ